MKNLVIAQSGGPTAAINASLAGIVERAMTCAEIGTIYGARYGIKGVLKDDLVDIGARLSSPGALTRLIHTPSSALGSCRVKLRPPEENESDYEKIFGYLASRGAGRFLYIGGNDSMDTVAKLSAYGKAKGIDISIMGVPKTIDNDLCGMDHSPGFGSAAKYIATTFSELWCDCRVYDIPAVTIVEVMGRHVGWLTAASALARGRDCPAPQLIYLPEVPFDNAQFIGDIKKELEKSPAVLIAVSEGLRRADGSFVGEDSQSGIADVFGHAYLSGAGRVLEGLVRREIGCKVRSVELNLMQRCAGHLASQSDLTEARLLGAAALDRALKGVSGEVSVLNRLPGEEYRVAYGSICAKEVANKEKYVPNDWISESGNDVTDEMIRYLTPLAQYEQLYSDCFQLSR
ncbi:MAG: 6-phosphofructokinase [Oscillospiraceae bacterium]|nr:6-phosphofructokinase [Oscillospiraceae bacterium]